MPAFIQEKDFAENKDFALLDFFSSFEEFFKYFRDTRVLMEKDDKKYR